MQFFSTFYLLLPVSGKTRLLELPDWGRRIVRSAKDQARGVAGQPVCLLGVSRFERRLWDLESGDRFYPSAFNGRGIHCLMNAGFLLNDTPPVQKMIRLAPLVPAVWCGLKAAREVHAVAFSAGSEAFGEAAVFRSNHLWTVLSCLTAGTEDRADGADDLWREFTVLPPSRSCEENSPALGQSKHLESRPSTYGPRCLNTAFREILASTVSGRGAMDETGAMIRALGVHRDRSEVPWFFNTLINEIEFRGGAVRPVSFPPEIHLSTTGRCNIECRFCGYTHDIARRDCVTREQVSTMTYLKYVQTFRLASGLGEPCLNPHLADIIPHISETHPHLGMNLFTNGLALDKSGLMAAIVGNVRWINVSLNAASPESYLAQCRTDGFSRICRNLHALMDRKHASGVVQPLVFGSMVLNRMNLFDLPKMPALCRDLGIDRFTTFPYFALGKREGKKFGPAKTLASCRREYDALFMKTVEAAEKHHVSLEIPPPSSEATSRFGLEVRPLYDFARIETNQWTLGRFLRGLAFDRPEDSYCHFLWRYAAIGSTNNTGHSPEETHFIYPCIGPLSGVDLSRRTAFRFQDEKGFLALWRHPVLELLRRAQHTEGISEVCDICRNNDTRHPGEFMRLEALVGRFAEIHRDGPRPVSPR